MNIYGRRSYCKKIHHAILHFAVLVEKKTSRFGAQIKKIEQNIKLS